MIKFVIQYPPTPQRRHRTRVVHTRSGQVFTRSYTDPKDEKEIDTLTVMLLEHRPSRPIEGPLELFIKCFLGCPKGFSKKKAKAALEGAIRPIMFDVDNLAKKMMDRMNKIFYADDRQIVQLTVSKWYGDPARWEIAIYRPVLTVEEG